MRTHGKSPAPKNLKAPSKGDVPTPLADTVRDWLRRVVTGESPPHGIVAYNIGLSETESGYSAYLLGAERYDPEDADWACSEAFTPNERYVSLPSQGRGGPRTVQREVAEAARAFLTSPEGIASFLATCEAVTVGFDDGDLVRVRWPQSVRAKP